MGPNAPARRLGLRPRQHRATSYHAPPPSCLRLVFNKASAVRPIAIVCVAALSGCLGAPGDGEPPSSEGQPGLVCLDPCRFPVSPPGENHAEPSVAVNPGNASHIVAASIGPFPAGFLQDSGAGQTWLYTHVSFDGGRSWTTRPVPGHDGAATTEPYASATNMGDPIVHILDDGTVLHAGLAYQSQGAIAPGPTSAFAHGGASLYVARSADGGLTFPETVIVARGVGVGLYSFLAGNIHQATTPAYEFSDKPWWTKAPDGNLLLAWSQGTARGPEETGPGRFDLRFSVSRDRGQSWSPPAVVWEGNSFGASPAVEPDGTYHIAVMEFPPPFQLKLFTSRDRGSTWTMQELGETKWFPTLKAVERAEGSTLFLAYPRPGSEEGFQVPVLLSSEDSGASWSDPLVLDEPEAAAWTYLAMDVDGDGVLYATFYHARADGALDFRLVAVRPDGSERRLVLDPGAATAEAGIYDYTGSAGLREGVVAIWMAGDGEGTTLRGALVR